MSLSVYPSKAKGKIQIASSKSYAHRFLLTACFADTPSRINNINYCDDVLATIECLKSLGVEVELNEDYIIVKPLKYSAINFNKIYEFNCNNSASTLRMMIPICLGLGIKSLFKVSDKLFERGIEGYNSLFRDYDVKVQSDNGYFYLDGKFNDYILNIDGSESSQYVSGALIGALAYRNDVIVKTSNIVSKSYIDMTIDVLRRFEIDVIKFNDDLYAVKKGNYQGIDVTLEPDYSLACVINSFNYFGGDVEVTNLQNNSLQADFKYIEAFKEISTTNSIINIENFIDLAPTLFVFATRFEKTTFINFDRLRIKESNRLLAMVELFNKFQIKYSLDSQQLIIYQSDIKCPMGIINTYHDHRIAMAAVILLSTTGGKIDDEKCIAKSYPNFLDDLRKLNIEYRVM